MENEHGGNIYAASREFSGQETWLDYSANINPLGLPGSVRDAMLHAIDSVIHYPDTAAYELKAAIGRHYQLSQEQITVGNGAVELFYVLCHALRPKQILVFAPTFSEYERAARAAGAALLYHSLSAEQGFQVDMNRLIAQVRKEQPDFIFLCNPNNPTGCLTHRQAIQSLVEAAGEKCLVIVDESFLDFISDDSITCLPLLAEFPNLIIAHSLTKFYAIPGLRLGFMAASPQITQLLERHKDPWNVNSLAQCAGIVALADQDYAIKSRNLILKEKNRFYRKLEQIDGLHPYPPEANFILVETSAAQVTAAELCQRMRQRHILIRDCSAYVGLNSFYIRLAVKLAAQNDQVIEALAASLKGE